MAQGMAIAALALLGILVVGPVRSQESARPAFDVASVKPTKSSTWVGVGGCMTPALSRGPCPGRFCARAASVKMLIEYAYHVRKINISGGPAWISTDPDFETTDAYYLTSKGLRKTNRGKIRFPVVRSRPAMLDFCAGCSFHPGRCPTDVRLARSSSHSAHLGPSEPNGLELTEPQIVIYLASLRKLRMSSPFRQAHSPDCSG
jgi:hypothetical protein